MQRFQRHHQEALRQYLDRYQPRIVPGHWYFPSPEGHRWDPDNFSADLRTANKKAHLTWSCLDYRHNAEWRIMPTRMSFDAP